MTSWECSHDWSMWYTRWHYLPEDDTPVIGYVTRHTTTGVWRACVEDRDNPYWTRGPVTEHDTAREARAAVEANLQALGATRK